MIPKSIQQSLDAFQIPPEQSPILVVDDEPQICEIIAMAFDGYPVKTAGGLVEAKAALSANQYRLVITDKNMPDGTGMDVIAEAKRLQHPRTEYILMTAYSNAESAIEAVSLGIYSYIQKPFDIAELQSIGEGALERNEAFFKSEQLIKELSDSYAKLFRRQTELDMAGELLEESVQQETEELKVAIHELIEALTYVGTLHSDLAGALKALKENKKLAKQVGPELAENWIQSMQVVSETCARHAALAKKRDF